MRIKSRVSEYDTFIQALRVCVPHDTICLPPAALLLNCCIDRSVFLIDVDLIASLLTSVVMLGSG